MITTKDADGNDKPVRCGKGPCKNQPRHTAQPSHGTSRLWGTVLHSCLHPSTGIFQKQTAKPPKKFPQESQPANSKTFPKLDSSYFHAVGACVILGALRTRTS